MSRYEKSVAAFDAAKEKLHNCALDWPTYQALIEEADTAWRALVNAANEEFARPTANAVEA
ncbi:MAG TPA: hypothetical protein VN950_01235 [Terriglobales bacterium]|nr:hypothetical protein [Terriglobales bacterium]